MHHKKVKMFNFRKDTLLHLLNAVEPNGVPKRVSVNRAHSRHFDVRAK